mgnify:CR=1 FL=1
MTNYKQDIDQINLDYVNLMYAGYLKGLWGITAGYQTVPPYLTITRKKLADWQLLQDCKGALCTASRSAEYTILAYPTLGTTTFSTGCDTECNPIPAISAIAPQQIIISTSPPFNIIQYTVGAITGPVAGSTIFTPLSAGAAYLIGMSVDIALNDYGPLTQGVDYSFNSSTGQITLLSGRLFNIGEVYTITSF